MTSHAAGSHGQGAGGGRFVGQHVLITGAGTGIGRAIALRLAAEGATLSLLARDVQRLHATLAEAVSAGAPPAHFAAACDVRDRASVDAAVAEAARRHGPLYAAIANSGIGGANAAPAPDAGPGAEPDRFEDLVATNLNGTYYLFRASERHLAPRPEAGFGARHLVAIASILARIGVAGYTGYCASKAGVTGLVRALAMELAPREVQVNALCPGWVDTSMARQGLEGLGRALGISPDAAHALAMKDVPLGRMSAPEDIAGVVAWLLSPDARGVTGQALDVNGGAFML
ncbi:MAG: SDR family NAD(P)-dependent oxidoreductase [Planctomycetota bacterium]